MDFLLELRNRVGLDRRWLSRSLSLCNYASHKKADRSASVFHTLTPSIPPLQDAETNDAADVELRRFHCQPPPQHVSCWATHPNETFVIDDKHPGRRWHISLFLPKPYLGIYPRATLSAVRACALVGPSTEFRQNNDRLLSR